MCSQTTRIFEIQLGVSEIGEITSACWYIWVLSRYKEITINNVVVRIVSGRIRSFELCVNVTIIMTAMLGFSNFSYPKYQVLINFQIVTMRCVWSSKTIRGSIPNSGYSIFDSGIRKSDFTRNALLIIHINGKSFFPHVCRWSKTVNGVVADISIRNPVLNFYTDNEWFAKYQYQNTAVVPCVQR